MISREFLKDTAKAVPWETNGTIAYAGSFWEKGELWFKRTFFKQRVYL